MYVHNFIGADRAVENSTKQSVNHISGASSSFRHVHATKFCGHETTKKKDRIENRASGFSGTVVVLSISLCSKVRNVTKLSQV